VWDLLGNYTEAARIRETDKDYAEEADSMHARLLGPLVGKWGQLQEWMVDRDDPKDTHRHVNHLFAVHPGRQIHPVTTPKLAEAAVISLNARGDGGTGWSLAWKINFWARLLDGNRAHTLCQNLLRNRILANGLDTHRPFQIDGNFGYTSGVAEMLLQSHLPAAETVNADGYLIHLLPALPNAWDRGSVKGLRARGAFEVDMEWAAGRLTKAVIKSEKGAPCAVRYGDKTMVPVIKAGTTLVLHAKDIE
jgi:alpha-L-fucosidase 2